MGYRTRRWQSYPSETCLAELKLPPATTTPSSTPVKKEGDCVMIDCNFSVLLIQRIFDVAMAFAKEPLVATEEQRSVWRKRELPQNAPLSYNATMSGRMATSRDRYTPPGMPQEPHQRAHIRTCYVCHKITLAILPGSGSIIRGSSCQVS